MFPDWITRGFEGFRAGTFGNGGQNLYVSHAGVLQRIYQYDLNHNGYFDLLFANCQNHHEAASSFLYENIFGTTVCSRLPAQGAVSGAVADLFNSGFHDLVLANNYDAAAPFASCDLYCGAASAYGEDRHFRLPAPWAESVAAGRFDGRRYALAFSQPCYQQIRLFKPSEIGFEWHRFDDLQLPTGQLAAADLDGDGFDELIVRRNNSLEVFIYWGGSDGIDPQRYTTLPDLPPEDAPEAGRHFVKRSELEKELVAPVLPSVVKIGGRQHLARITGKRVIFLTFNTNREPEVAFELAVPQARAVAAGCIRGNGETDLAVVAQHRTGNGEWSYLYYGSPEGYSENNRVAIATGEASDATFGRFDQSPYDALVIAQSHSEFSYDRDLLIFQGSPTGIHPKAPHRLPGSDTQRVFAVPRPGQPDALLAINHYSRSAVGMDRAYLYYGGPDGYHADRREELPCWCAVESIYADLDDDGWSELVICNNSENAMHRDPGCHIHHFNASGFDPTRTSTLPTEIGWGGFVADLRHSGYLDLVTVCNQYRDLVFFPGSATGFDPAKRTILRLERPDGSHYGSPRWICAVDLQNRGYLDLVIPIINGDRTLILHGGPEGYSMTRHSELAVTRGVCAQAADLTGNGYPDLIIGTHTEIPRNGRLAECMPHHSFVHIYWNDGNGLRENNKTTLRAYAADSIAVADFNNDGWLDLFVGSYHTGRERDCHSLFYWNRQGHFREDDRQLLYTHSASGCIAADFNNDGFIDLAVANHKINGDHTGFSSVWWNGPGGFDRRHRTDLPTAGPHGMTALPVGNILDRKPDEFYTSAPYRLPQAATGVSGSWLGEIPESCSVLIRFRHAPKESELGTAPWSHFLHAGEKYLLELPAASYVQYQLALRALNSLRSPRLTEINVRFEIQPAEKPTAPRRTPPLPAR